MAVLPILTIPDPILRRRARKIKSIDAGVLRLAYDMVDTMRDAGGVGLAANQVGVLRRVIVIQLPEDKEASIYINPEIVHRDGEREVEEGCLSYPGWRGTITRSIWVKFRALDASSEVIKIKAEGLLSQALEHEVDHLNGILFIDHLKSHDLLVPVETVSVHPINGAAGIQDLPDSANRPGGDGPDMLSRPVLMPDVTDMPASLKVR